MTHVMTPSEMTPGQIAKIQENLGAALRKAGFPQDPAQEVIVHHLDSLIAEFVTGFRKRIEVQSDLIVRRVIVDRRRSPTVALKATKRNNYLNDSVVSVMPKGVGEEVDVVFFKIGRYVSDPDLEKEYELRGLIPADPYSLAAVNETDPTFADDCPNGTRWKNSSGKWCSAIFYRSSGGRHVSVNRNDNDWNDNWWFAGPRNSLHNERPLCGCSFFLTV